MTRHSPSCPANLRALTGATIAAAAVTALVPITAQAAVACSETALAQAINSANAAGGANIVLTPRCTYKLTATRSNVGHGPNGLPVITTVITLTGDQNLITRGAASSVPAFRIAEVARTGRLTLKSVTLNNGRAVGAGGGILNFGSVTLTASALTNNVASTTGGGLSSNDIAAPATGATATMTNSTVSDNTATGRGGGVYNGLRGSLTTTSSTIRGNSSSQRGGGIAAINSTATTLTSTPISINLASMGAGGIYRAGGTMTITSSPITFNDPNNCVGSVPAVPSCTA